MWNDCAAVNVALQKPALLVATNGTYTAGKAVDGLQTTIACAPATSIQPWFQVDLGVPKFVDSVRITGNTTLGQNSYECFFLFTSTQ